MASMSEPNFSPDLFKNCYQAAYFALPRLLFSQQARVLRYFTDNEYPVGPFVYAMAAQVMKFDFTREDALAFEAHSGALNDDKNYHVLQYPTPPLFDLASKGGVLAPFFSAIIHDSSSDAVNYFVLGQNPLQGTTLRTVTPAGANANLGPGPRPELAEFIAALRQRI